jgi:sigma-B regulation protein RsbU (phosphoserine phosphatase)
MAITAGTFFALPLRHKEEVLGVLLLGKKITGGRYTGEDETLLTAMANQVSIALLNAELHETTLRQVELERDLDTARRIQSGFLPKQFPARKGIDIFGQNVPSREVGGDYYDVLEQGGHAIVLAVADVSGKGVPAALLASMLQASLRTQVSGENRVGRIIQRLNSLVCESTAAEQFATFFLGRVDLARMRLTYSNAGHNFPILLREDNEALFLDHSDLILGLSPQIEYEEISVDLRPGDRLVLFTDGISEANVNVAPSGDVDQLGEEGLVRLLQEMGDGTSASAMVEGIHHRLKSMVCTEDEADDMTLLILKVAAAVEISQAGVLQEKAPIRSD